MINANERARLNSLKISDIVKVYSGKAHQCCCGCSGQYFYNPQHPKAATHEVRFSDKMVKKIMSMIKNTPVDEIDADSSYFAIEVGQRQYIAYLN